MQFSISSTQLWFLTLVIPDMRIFLSYFQRVWLFSPYTEAKNLYDWPRRVYNNCYIHIFEYNRLLGGHFNILANVVRADTISTGQCMDAESLSLLYIKYNIHVVNLRSINVTEHSANVTLFFTLFDLFLHVSGCYGDKD